MKGCGIHRLGQPRFAFLGLAFLLLSISAAMYGDDGAASVGAGGIQLRREARISMQTERLLISFTKVAVEFEFLNDTQEDVTTEVAFPIPPYSCGPEERLAKFDDFHVWLENSPLTYLTDIHAMLKGKDVTKKLRDVGLDTPLIDLKEENCYDPQHTEIGQLPTAQKEKLKNLNLTQKSVGWPLWAIRKTYYWRMTFPAHQIVRIRHEYTPAAGFGQIPAEYFDPASREQTLKDADRVGYPRKLALEHMRAGSFLITDSCLDRSVASKLSRSSQAGLVWTGSVNYILTSANTWKMPIKDFQLDVEFIPPGRKPARIRQFLLGWSVTAPRPDPPSR